MDQTVTFDASSSTDTDGSIALYEWDWDGDGTYDDSGTIASITHTFTSAGSHTVTLRVTDDQDATDTSSETIDVNAAPEALFSHDPANPNAGEIITFDASSSTDTDGSIVLYEWDWDDDGVYDATSTTSDASHAFSSVSGHAVTLRITDDDGATDTYTQIIGVNAAPNAAFDHAPRSPLAGQSITFDASPSSDPDGTIVLFEWDWDDDGTYDDTGVLTTFYYVEAGLHDVTLRVTDDSGATDTFTGTLSIRPQVSPLVSFTPMRNMMLLRANTIFTEVHDQLPEDVPDDVSELLDQVSMHMHNATSTANTIYANGELTKAVELMEEILSLI